MMVTTLACRPQPLHTPTAVRADIAAAESMRRGALQRRFREN
jgi:hypothetical protein